MTSRPNPVRIERLEDNTELKKYFKTKAEENIDEAIYVVDLAKVAKKYQEWKHYFPNIELFYATKCNSDPVINKFLAKLGCGFDCASYNEIKAIMDFDVKPENIIFSNPIKFVDHIKSAKERGVMKSTFDSEEELEKISKYFPESEVVIRLKTADENSAIQLSKKFGAAEKYWETLVKKCQKLNLNLIGVSFHIGTGSYDTSTFDKSLKDSKKVFELAKQYGFELSFLDIGGGFPGTDDATPSFKDFAAQVNYSIKKYFSDYDNLRIIGEPGRFMVTESHYLITQVISRRVNDEKVLLEEMEKLEIAMGPIKNNKRIKTNHSNRNQYFIKESTSLSFSNKLFENCSYKPKFIEDHSNEPTYESYIYGQSNFKNDKIGDNIDLPILKRNEYIYWENMGAYTTSIGRGIEYNLNPMTESTFYVWVDDSLFNPSDDYDYGEVLKDF